MQLRTFVTLGINTNLTQYSPTLGMCATMVTEGPMAACADASTCSGPERSLNCEPMLMGSGGLQPSRHRPLSPMKIQSQERAPLRDPATSSCPRGNVPSEIVIVPPFCASSSATASFVGISCGCSSCSSYNWSVKPTQQYTLAHGAVYKPRGACRLKTRAKATHNPTPTILLTNVDRIIRHHNSVVNAGRQLAINAKADHHWWIGRCSPPWQQHGSA